MFICQSCGNATAPNTRCNKIVIQEKVVIHPFRARANRIRFTDGRWEDTPDMGGKGSQIVREISVCVNCIDKYTKK